MPYIMTQNFSYYDTTKEGIRIDLSPAGGFWVVHCALTRVQVLRENQYHHAAIGISSAEMPNPPLFEGQPERWHPTLFGKGISRISVGIVSTNCFINGYVYAHRWD